MEGCRKNFTFTFDIMCRLSWFSLTVAHGAISCYFNVCVYMCVCNSARATLSFAFLVIRVLIQHKNIFIYYAFRCLPLCVRTLPHVPHFIYVSCPQLVHAEGWALHYDGRRDCLVGHYSSSTVVITCPSLPEADLTAAAYNVKVNC